MSEPSIGVEFRSLTVVVLQTVTRSVNEGERSSDHGQGTRWPIVLMESGREVYHGDTEKASL